MSDLSTNNCPNCSAAWAAEDDACAKCGRKRDQSQSSEPTADRTAVHTQTLARYRQSRDKIRGVKILAECCPACDLDSNREFALDAVPPLPNPYCTNPKGCRCCYMAVPHGSEATENMSRASLIVVPPVSVTSSAAYEEKTGLLQAPMTPLAAIIGACGLVLFVGFGVIRNASAPSTSPSRTVTLPARFVASQPLAQITTAPRIASMGRVPEISASDRARERQIEAEAARDLRRSEEIAAANTNALQANAIAATQQAYLQSAFGSQVASRPMVSASASMANATLQ